MQSCHSERRVLILDCSGLNFFDYTGVSVLLQVFMTPDKFRTQKYNYMYELLGPTTGHLIYQSIDMSLVEKINTDLVLNCTVFIYRIV